MSEVFDTQRLFDERHDDLERVALSCVELIAQKSRPILSDGSGWVRVGGAPLVRSEFLNAVSIATGRQSPDTEVVEMETLNINRQAPSRAEAERSGCLILVAEDDETNRKVIQRQLDMLGFAADVAHDGKEAFRLWSENRYGLLLTDCHMPEMNGFTLTASIRSTEVTSGGRIPIIALTANALKGEAEKCFAYDMDAFLSKPVQRSDLLAEIEKWMPTRQEAHLSEENNSTGDEQPIDETPKSDEKLNSSTDQSEVNCAENAVFDELALSKLVGDDMEIISSFLHEFLKSTNEDILCIQSSVEMGNPAEAGRIAHKLKSSSKSVGADALSDLCAKMEYAGKKDDLIDVERYAASMKTLFEITIERIETYIGKGELDANENAAQRSQEEATS